MLHFCAWDSVDSDTVLRVTLQKFLKFSNSFCLKVRLQIIMWTDNILETESLCSAGLGVDLSLSHMIYSLLIIHILYLINEAQYVYVFPLSFKSVSFMFSIISLSFCILLCYLRYSSSPQSSKMGVLVSLPAACSLVDRVSWSVCVCVCVCVWICLLRIVDGCLIVSTDYSRW